MGDQSFSSIPIKQVCKQLFDIKYVDQANDAHHAVNFFTDRLTKKCCNTMYQLVIADYNLQGINNMSRTIVVLSKLRDSSVARQNNADMDHSDIQRSRSLTIESSQINTVDSFMIQNNLQHIQQRFKRCAVVGIADRENLPAAEKNEQGAFDIVTDQTGVQTFLTKNAVKRGFSLLVNKPFGTEQLTVLLDKFVTADEIRE